MRRSRIFLNEASIPYEQDEVTRLIVDEHDAGAFAPIAASPSATFATACSGRGRQPTLAALAPGLTPEMVAAVSKVMRVQDLILVARKCRVVTRFATPSAFPGGCPRGCSRTIRPTIRPASPPAILDGLLYGSGDAVIGINPATTACPPFAPCWTCSTTSSAIRYSDAVLRSDACDDDDRGDQPRPPVDLVFQSIAGTERPTELRRRSRAAGRGREAALALTRGTIGDNVMYFETGQGSALSANAHHGVDQQTCEARAYAVARRFKPLLVNTVVGFIGPEYLYNGKQIIRAGLEDHFCGKLLGLPMGCDICYTNHAEADQDDMDMLLTLLPAAGCTFIMGVPGSDDIMLSYQTTSFHDALYARETLGLHMAPEFEDWLLRMGIFDDRWIDGIRRLRPRETCRRHSFPRWHVLPDEARRSEFLDQTAPVHRRAHSAWTRRREHTDEVHARFPVGACARTRRRAPADGPGWHCRAARGNRLSGDRA